MNRKPDLADAVAVRLSEVSGQARLLEHVVQNREGLLAAPLARLLCDLDDMHARLEKHRHALRPGQPNQAGS